MFVSKRMATDLISVDKEMTIFEAKKLMTDKRIRHLPVVDSEGKLLGIVSDRDMRDAMPSTLLKKPDYETTLNKIGSHKIDAIMTREPLTIYAYYTLQDALLVMQKKKVGALPVIDEGGYLKGILSTRDLIKAFVNMLNIDEPGSLLCVVVQDKPGQMKKIVDVISEENIALGSILVARYWEKGKRVVFPYLLTNNLMSVKQKLLNLGFDLIDPLKWYMEKLPNKGE
jgi:acetoin utilization protein AcuB